MRCKNKGEIIVRLSWKRLASLLLAEFLAMYLLFMVVSYYAQAGTLAKFILEDLCVYNNTITAREIVQKHNLSCITVLINRDHVRYKLPNGTIIDPICGKACDNMEYLEFTFCKK